MGRRLPRACALLAAGVLTLPLIDSPVSAASTATVTPVGVITQDPFANPASLSHADAYALGKMEERAQANPGVYAVPYVANGTLYSPVVNPAEQLNAATLSVPPAPAQQDDGTDDLTAVPPPDEVGKPADPDPPAAAAATVPEQKTPQPQAAPQAVPPRVNLWIEAPLVQHSLTQLETIRDEVLELTPDVLPGVENLVSATIHPERNQVVVEANAAPEALRTTLAARYGDAVVVHLTDAGTPQPLGRQNDTSPYYGGAKTVTNVYTCSTGFSWSYLGASYMLSAGHCTSLGGYAKPHNPDWGAVIKDNWNNSKGTVKIDGQSVYRGDLSLIRVRHDRSSAGRIFVGNAQSSASRAVAGMPSRRTRPGDRFCSGGISTGELCGWEVKMVGVTVNYGGGKVARNVIFAQKRGQCLVGGDSGGSAYTVNSSGKIVAKGIVSGGWGNGTASSPCRGFFTDIWHAHDGLPGVLKTG
ncbi:S1 family peptidase [Rhizohabitans arisaemae]|uniref:S1 family peptidase n=1 Tax=Rhizohabitans arisaemae TaxID=2720610 RepID=UPI0024B1758E|nr:S1 family peptidase [Rhizohabitans arisaemae]